MFFHFFVVHVFFCFFVFSTFRFLCSSFFLLSVSSIFHLLPFIQFILILFFTYSFQNFHFVFRFFISFFIFHGFLFSFLRFLRYFLHIFSVFLFLFAFWPLSGCPLCGLQNSICHNKETKAKQDLDLFFFIPFRKKCHPFSSLFVFLSFIFHVFSFVRYPNLTFLFISCFAISFDFCFAAAVKKGNVGASAAQNPEQ